MISKSHTSPERRNLVLKYSFSNVTGCLYCCLRSTKNWLWQLEFMYIHTVGGTQTTSEEVLLHLVKPKWNKTNWKKKRRKILHSQVIQAMMCLLSAGSGWKLEEWKRKTVLFDLFDCADFMEEEENIMFASSYYCFPLNFATSNRSMLMRNSLQRETE